MNYRTSDWEFHLALFVNHITNYITLRSTGNTEPDRGYPILEYYGSNARFLGGEFTMKRTLIDRLELSFGSDYIHGSELQNKSREPLPFIPPLRIFAGATFDTGRWWSHLGVRHVLAQNRTAEAEDRTGGYTLTNVSVGAKLGSNNIHHIYLCAENLFHITWRDHLSRIERRDIPMVGRNIRLSYRYFF